MEKYLSHLCNSRLTLIKRIISILRLLEKIKKKKDFSLNVNQLPFFQQVRKVLELIFE